jgi:hypothetical protein
MQDRRIAAVMIGGLFLASPVMAQNTNLAYATGEPRSETIVFLQRGNVLPPSAAPMVSNAIIAARAGKTVHLVGRQDQAEVVKDEMVRDGAPASAIVVAHDPMKDLPRVDGVSASATRTVAIKY